MVSYIIYKHVTAIIIFAAFLAQTFSKTFVIAGYYTNWSAYAKKCENKAKPVMHCNGKCQMMKKLVQEEKKEEQNPERKGENKNETSLSPESFFALLSVPGTELLKSDFGPLQNSKETKRPRFVFHPPSV